MCSVSGWQKGGYLDHPDSVIETRQEGEYTIYHIPKYAERGKSAPWEIFEYESVANLDRLCLSFNKTCCRSSSTSVHIYKGRKMTTECQQNCALDL